jgi:uncharacterized RDD family membrane protein YckC/tRNA A-37 threonylcarbamoyl transferase component Bud32
MTEAGGADPTLPLGSMTPGSGPISTDRWTGTDLDFYRLIKQLGVGGMGAVYLAHDTSLDRKVAIKVLPDQLYGNKEIEERFLREARAQASLQSPYVVAIHHIGRLPVRGGGKTGLYFAMELVDGEPLEAILERKSILAPEEARDAMLQVAKGLRDAHNEDIIHRDIKPSNLLRDKQGRVKIADFGIAKVSSVKKDDRKSLTQEGVVLGTPLYMSPEQASGERIDFRSDMYSLGCTFYHLLAGVPPFDGNNGLHVAAQHITRTPPPLSDLVKDLPPALAAIFDRLLAKKREDRYATYDELIAALEAAAPQAIAFAGFWARAAALALDCVIAGALVAFLGWLGVLVHLAYVTIGHAYFGRTIPKWMLSMHVHRRDGSKLGLGRAFVRNIVAMWLPFYAGTVILVTKGTSHLRGVVEHLQPGAAAEAKNIVTALAISHGVLTLLWLAGLAYAAFNPERRAFHDIVAGSHVTYMFRRLSLPPKPPPR